MKNCERCEVLHDGTFATGRFCSLACANKRVYSDLRKKEVYKKVSDSSKKTRPEVWYTINCIECGKIKTSRNSKRKFCSNSCKSIFRWKDPVYAQTMANQISERQLKRAREGKHPGWPKRKTGYMSFAERVVHDMLKTLNIPFEFDYKINRWFADFAFLEKKIIIEIDGRQHQDVDRKAKDQIKDFFLQKEGWTVHRIPWVSLTKETHKMIQEQVSSILNDYIKL